MTSMHSSLLRALITLLILSGTAHIPAARAEQPGAGQNMLSPAAQISLLTASPGEELYSLFGHSALWVSDPIRGIDEVYNYGTFDFNTPNFYLKFMRGQLLYQLSVTSMRVFLYDYEREGRAMYQQRLNLLDDEKEVIYRFLQHNRKPENRLYLYDFFYDNCATRIRDLIDELLQPDWGEDPHPHQTRSFRQMLQPYLANTPWAAFGIDLVLGLPADRIASPWHYMFLPDEMFIAFEQARLPDGRALTASYSVILPPAAPAYEASRLISLPRPTALMWSLFVLGLISLFSSRASGIFDRFFFSALGLSGLVIVFLWFFSDHQATNQNLNLLWTLPSHLLFVWTGKGRARWYFALVALTGFLLLAAWPLNPQGFHTAFFPLIALLVIKSLWRVRRG